MVPDAARQLLGGLRRIVLVVAVVSAALLLAQLLRHQEGQLEAWLALSRGSQMGVVAVGEVIVRDRLAPPMHSVTS